MLHSLFLEFEKVSMFTQDNTMSKPEYEWSIKNPPTFVMQSETIPLFFSFFGSLFKQDHLLSSTNLTTLTDFITGCQGFTAHTFWQLYHISNI
jgi:hypothetical protein